MFVISIKPVSISILRMAMVMTPEYLKMETSLLIIGEGIVDIELIRRVNPDLDEI